MTVRAVHILRRVSSVDALGQAHEHCEGTDRSEELEFALHTHGRPIAPRGHTLNRRLETWCSR